MNAKRAHRSIELHIDAVILCVLADQPAILTRRTAAPRPELPSSMLDPAGDATLELTLRRFVKQQTGLSLGYVEQLYTFGDRGRDPSARRVSIAYLALSHPSDRELPEGLDWIPVYQLFPWEDRREQPFEPLQQAIFPQIQAWSSAREDHTLRADITFALGGGSWDTARVLERYELMYELGLVAEKAFDAGKKPKGNHGLPLSLDHRRVVATALSRIRGKLSYRPVVFELLEPEFTLSKLQDVVESLAGAKLHTPNFRRLLEANRLVEPTGKAYKPLRGRPAQLYKFRQAVLRERPAPGIGLPGAR